MTAAQEILVGMKKLAASNSVAHREKRVIARQRLLCLALSGLLVLRLQTRVVSGAALVRKFIVTPCWILFKCLVFIIFGPNSFVSFQGPRRSGKHSRRPALLIPTEGSQN